MRDQPELIDPKDEPTRQELIDRPTDWSEFLERTRRYHKLTHGTTKLHYARGLDSKPGDFA